MVSLKRNETGVAHLAAILVVVLLAVVAVAGYRVVHKSNDAETANSSSSTTVPKKIESKSDVKQASEALDSDQNDNSLDPSQLDSDLNNHL